MRRQRAEEIRKRFSSCCGFNLIQSWILCAAVLESEMDLHSCSYQKNFSVDWSSTSFDDLPDGLVTDILSRLPVKTLVQSTSVCRIWYSIIKSPSFISIHLSRSTDDPSNYFILLIRTWSSSLSFIVVSDNNLLTRNPDLHFRFETQSESQEIIGTCNGLVCLTEYGRDIYLVNPFIHKYKKLVLESSCYADLILQNNHDSHVVIHVGFGYSEDENDFKVVRILIHYCNATRLVLTTKVEIYSLKSGTWKGIDASFEIAPDFPPVFVHGCLYWCLWETFPQLDGHVLCFDLKDEVFSKIKLPTVFFQHCTFSKPPNILAKNGSVAVAFAFALDPVNHFKDFTSYRFCLLVLENDIGGEVLWKEFYYDNVDIIPAYCKGFGVSGRLIYFNGWKPHLDAVDLDNSCAIEELALNDGDCFTVALNAMESLVLFSD